MNDLIISKFNGQTVRATEDGRFSVYDVLAAFEVCSKSHSQQTLKRISVNYPEVTPLCVNFKFPGRGQRETPVADESGIYQILMLCPGKRGSEFRKWASDIVERYRKADGTLAEDIVKRQTPKDAKRTAQRINGIAQRKAFTDTLKAHGVNESGFGICTNQTYIGLFGKKANELKNERGLAKTTLLRDHMDDVELSALSLAESLAARQIERKNLQGVKPCSKTCHSTAESIRTVIDSYDD